MDSETQVPGVTSGRLRPEIKVVAEPSTTDGGNMDGTDFDVTASWGHFGSGQAVMPGQGRVVERAYTADERKAMGDSVSVLGDKTFDVYLNDRAYWRNVPSSVWSYKLGGYQVLKKWLSYRESKVLGRSLKPDEVQHFAADGAACLGYSGAGDTRGECLQVLAMLWFGLLAIWLVDRLYLPSWPLEVCYVMKTDGPGLKQEDYSESPA